MNTRNLRFRSNRVGDILAQYHEELDPLYGPAEVSVFCQMLFEDILGWDKVALMLNKGNTINQSDMLHLHWALEDLLRQRPIQHIIGHTDFCGCRIDVDPNVLIPRPETEEMVEHLKQAVAAPASILDLCTGSGCIAIALKKAFPSAHVSAVDVSPAAIGMARHNADRNGTPVDFIQADILGGSPDLHDPFSLIVSNPPYVLESERQSMRSNVLDHEPHIALFVPDADPLLFYRAIAHIARRSLAPGGILMVEVNEALADETAALLHADSFATTILTDFRGKQRFVSATHPTGIS